MTYIREANGDESIRKVLDAADELTDTALTIGPEAYAPIAEAAREGPQEGVAAYRSIRTYGEAFAVYLEQQAASAMACAELYRDQCLDLAQRVRITSEDEAMRAVHYTNRIQSMAKTLDEVNKLQSQPI